MIGCSHIFLDVIGTELAAFGEKACRLTVGLSKNGGTYPEVVELLQQAGQDHLARSSYFNYTRLLLTSDFSGSHMTLVSRLVYHLVGLLLWPSCLLYFW